MKTNVSDTGKLTTLKQILYNLSETSEISKWNNDW